MDAVQLQGLSGGSALSGAHEAAPGRRPRSLVMAAAGSPAATTSASKEASLKLTSKLGALPEPPISRRAVPQQHASSGH